MIAILTGTFAAGPLARLLYAPLARALDAEVWELPSAGLGPLDETVKTVSRRVREPVHLVGHSQGGVVAALVADRNPLVESVVALGAPFQGAWGGHFTPVPGLQDLSLPQEVRSTRVTCVAGTRDLLVPPWVAHLRGRPLHEVPTGHVGLILHPQAVGLTCRLVTEKRAGTPLAVAV